VQHRTATIPLGPIDTPILITTATKTEEFGTLFHHTMQYHGFLKEPTRRGAIISERRDSNSSTAYLALFSTTRYNTMGFYKEPTRRKAIISERRDSNSSTAYYLTSTQVLRLTKIQIQHALSKIASDASRCRRISTSPSSPLLGPILGNSKTACSLARDLSVRTIWCWFGWDCIVATGLTFRFINTQLN
jgi:hypothetical protein